MATHVCVHACIHPSIHLHIYTSIYLSKMKLKVGRWTSGVKRVGRVGHVHRYMLYIRSWVLSVGRRAYRCVVCYLLGVLDARSEVSGTQGYPSMENGEQREQEDKKTRRHKKTSIEGGKAGAKRFGGP